jgi:phosphatidate cytidylyltransferase
VDANLRLRVATAGVGIPLLIGLVGWSPVFVFSGFFLLLTLAALWEFYALVFPQHWFGRAAGILSGFGLAQLALAVGASIAANLLVLALICVFAALLFYRDLVEPWLTRWSWSAIGGFYIGYLLPHLILLFGQPNGRAWVFWLFLVVMAGDSAAYFIGRRFGSRKLAPRLSPGKTVEGACGYVVGAVLGGFVAAALAFERISWWEMFALSLAVSVLGQFGDLFESWIKRVHHVKDSGMLLPGHGGVLDRLDSLIFPAAFTTVYLRMFHS